MKKVALFASIILALTMFASAEDIIDFTHLAPATTPQPINPQPYQNLMWTAIDYVSTPLYDKWLDNHGGQEGAGFKTGPEAQVALIGGPMCYLKPIYGSGGSGTIDDVCRGTISVAGANYYFRPEYLIASEGWAQDGHQFVTVVAYLNGKEQGSQRFDLGTDAQKFKLVLPDEWGAVTELQLWPSPGGSVVLYVVGVK